MEKKMNIYAKLMKVRVEFHRLNLKKSGENTYKDPKTNKTITRFRYFELADFLIEGTKLLEQYGLCPAIAFDKEYAILTLFNCDNPDETIQFTSPMKYDERNNSEIQSLGSSQTYLTRYLYIQLLNIVESDGVDSMDIIDRNGKTANNNDTITEDDVDKLYKLGYKKGYLRGTVDDQIKKKYNKEIRELSKEEYENIQLGYEKCKDSKDKK